MLHPRPGALRALLGALLVGVALAATPAAAQPAVPPRPSPPRLVNDYANLLAAAERDALERKLVAFSDSFSTQIAVVIMPTLGGTEPSVFATELGEAWGVGGQGQDNGVVLLVAVQDREVFIAAGRGAEGSMPDAVAARIVRNVIVPAFREGRFYAGIDGGADAIIAATRGEFVAEDPPAADFPVVNVVVLVLMAVVIFSFVFGGSNRGGGGGRRRRSGSGVVFVPGGWGGGWSSGGSSFGGGGGFSGGGFGGFGGGSFGGGGAGGSW